MNSRRRYSVLTLIVVLSTMLVSCNKIPQDEIDAAKAAIDSARLEGISPTNSLKFALLEDSVLQIFEAVEQHKSTLTFKNLDDSRKQLIILTREINLLRTEFNSGKANKMLSNTKFPEKHALGGDYPGEDGKRLPDS